MKSSVRWDDSWKPMWRQLDLYFELSLVIVFSGLSSWIPAAFTAHFYRKRTSDNVSYVRFGRRFSLENRQVGTIVRAGNGRRYDVLWGPVLRGSGSTAWLASPAASRRCVRREIWRSILCAHQVNAARLARRIRAIVRTARASKNRKLGEGGSERGLARSPKLLSGSVAQRLSSMLFCTLGC